MTIITPGHRYRLDNFNPVDLGAKNQEIQFVENAPRVYGAPGEMQREVEGTTNEEVLEVLIDRLKYLNGKFGCRENALALTKLEEARMWLNERTRERESRGVEGKAKA